MSRSKRAGWRLLKSSNTGQPRGSRLMRSPDDESRSFQTWEGFDGWKKDLSLVRTFRVEPARAYTMIALDSRDSPIATVKGKDDDGVWNNMFAALKLAGVMPADAVE